MSGGDMAPINQTLFMHFVNLRLHTGIINTHGNLILSKPVQILFHWLHKCLTQDIFTINLPL